MTTRIFVGAKVLFSCATCGRKHTRSIPWTKTHRQISCSCGAIIDVTSMRDKLLGINQAAGGEKSAQHAH